MFSKHNGMDNIKLFKLTQTLLCAYSARLKREIVAFLII
jgi:hypothetical protein